MEKKQNQLKIAMAWWWTGGHVFPIKSLIEHLDHKPEFLWKIAHIYRFGNKHALEHTICQSLQKNNILSFVSIVSWKYRRETFIKAKIKNIGDMFLFGMGVIQSLFRLIRYRINIVFCKGGYIALPVVIAAKILGKKIIVHESDTHPWLVNKIAAKFAQKTFTGFEWVLPTGECAGQILSDDILFDGKLEEYPEMKKLFAHKDKTKPRILVIGWSQWSQRLYQSLLKALETDKSLQTEVEFILILWLLNKDLKPYFQKFHNVAIFDFVNQKEMGILCYYCDIAITRAGTTSLAEQKLYDMKLFIVPIAWTHDQYDNARRYEKHYQDIMLDQKDESFLNKLVIEIKKHKNFKKILTEKDRKTFIHIAKDKIWEAILVNNW